MFDRDEDMISTGTRHPLLGKYEVNMPHIIISVINDEQWCKILLISKYLKCRAETSSGCNDFHKTEITKSD